MSEFLVLFFDQIGRGATGFLLVWGLFALWLWRLCRREYARAIERRLSSWPGKP